MARAPPSEAKMWFSSSAGAGIGSERKRHPRWGVDNGRPLAQDVEAAFVKEAAQTSLGLTTYNVWLILFTHRSSSAKGCKHRAQSVWMKNKEKDRVLKSCCVMLCRRRRWMPERTGAVNCCLMARRASSVSTLSPMQVCLKCIELGRGGCYAIWGFLAKNTSWVRRRGGSAHWPCF